MPEKSHTTHKDVPSNLIAGPSVYVSVVLSYLCAGGASRHNRAAGHTLQCTEVRFASFLFGGFTTMAVINPPESKLAKRTSVKCFNISSYRM